MHIRWFPPSWLLIKTQDKVIYIDPAWIQHNFDKYPHTVVFSHYPESMDGLPEKDMPKADIILITHHHQDHIKTATLNRLAMDETVIIAPQKCTSLVGRDFEVIRPNEIKEINGVTVKAVFAYNTPHGHSTRKPHHKGECVGYLVRSEGKTLYHAGDTDCIPEMTEVGNVDVAFLPVGGTFTMDMGEAIAAVKIIKPKITVPMHFLHTQPEAFQQLAQQQKISFKILSVGETIHI